MSNGNEAEDLKRIQWIIKLSPELCERIDRYGEKVGKDEFDRPLDRQKAMARLIIIALEKEGIE